MKRALSVCEQKEIFLRSEMQSAGDHDIVVKKLYTHVSDDADSCHEVLSEVIWVGKEVKNIEIGMRLYSRLTQDRENRTTDFSLPYMLISNPKLDEQVYDLPSRIPAKEASLIGVFAQGFHAARRASPKQGENAVVFGANTRGIASAIALKHFGCHQVILCDCSDYRLKKADNLGFAVCSNDENKLKETAASLFGTADSTHEPNENVSIYVDATGTETALEIYRDIGMAESRMVLFAPRSGNQNVSLSEMAYTQHTFIGSNGYTSDDIEDVVAVMVQKRWDIESIITDEFSGKQISEAIKQAGDIHHALSIIVSYE